MTRGIAQLIMALFEGVAILAHPLRQEFFHEAAKSRVRLVEGAQILNMIDEPPCSSRIRIGLGTLPCKRAHRGDQVLFARSPRAHLSYQRIRQHLLGEHIHSNRIIRHAHQTQRSNDISDDLVVAQRPPPCKATRNTIANQPLLELLAYSMLAVEESVISPRSFPVAFAVRNEIGKEPRTLRRFVFKGVCGHDVPRFFLSTQMLVEEGRVLRHECSRHLENLPRATAVPVQHNRLQNIEVVLEPDEDFRIRTGPREN